MEKWTLKRGDLASEGEPLSHRRRACLPACLSFFLTSAQLQLSARLPWFIQTRTGGFFFGGFPQ